MTVHDDIRQALHDAIGWQAGLVDAYRHMPDAPEYRDALDTIKRYRAILRRRYGTGRAPHLDAMVKALMRVELHPATDRWMMGDQFGTVVDSGPTWVKVKMDRSGKTIKVAREDLKNETDRP